MELNLTDHFLIAMPSMADPYFSRTLIYICEHNENGALGLIVNRAIDLKIDELFDKIDIKLQNEFLEDDPILFGGPVQVDRGFVLHSPLGEWQSTLKVNENIGLTTSKDILEAVGKGEGPTQFLIALGYAGWTDGKLEDEILQNEWLTLPADYMILFDQDLDEKLVSAMKNMGLNLLNLSSDFGHS